MAFVPAKFQVPGETGLMIIRAAVAEGAFACEKASQVTAANKAYGHGYLTRDQRAGQGHIFYATDRARDMLAYLAERQAERTSAPPARLPHHPLAALFPMMDADALDRLTESVRTVGQELPVILLDGMILDGRNRDEACFRLGIDPYTEEYQGKDPLGFVLALNLDRRHLTDSQRAMVAAKIVIWKRGINQNTAGSANLPTRDAARMLSISERAVIAAKRVDAHGVQELSDAIREGRVSVHAGEAISRLEEDAQRAILKQEKRELLARAKEARTEHLAKTRAIRTGLIAEIARHGRHVAGEMPRRAFPVIYGDPPWQQEAWSDETGQDRGLMYPAMPLQDIMDLCAGDRSPATPDAVAYLWVPANRLDDGIAVLKAWGFEFVTCMVWDKQHIGMGRWVRDRAEFLLIGKRGDFPCPLPGTQPESLYSEVKSEHSRKPVWFAEMIDRLYPDLPKLELFQRAESLSPDDIRRRGKWAFWGFEASTAESEVA